MNSCVRSFFGKLILQDQALDNKNECIHKLSDSFLHNPKIFRGFIINSIDDTENQKRDANEKVNGTEDKSWNRVFA